MILLGSAATSAFILRYLIPEVPLFVCGGVLALRELMPGRASPLAETRPEPARAAAGAPR